LNDPTAFHPPSSPSTLIAGTTKGWPSKGQPLRADRTVPIHQRSYWGVGQFGESDQGPCVHEPANRSNGGGCDWSSSGNAGPLW